MGITAEQAAEQLDQVLNEAADGFRPVEEEMLNDEDFYDDDEPPFGPPVSRNQQWTSILLTDRKTCEKQMAHDSGSRLCCSLASGTMSWPW